MLPIGNGFVAPTPMGPLSFCVIDLFKFMCFKLGLQLSKIRKCWPCIASSLWCYRRLIPNRPNNMKKQMGILHIIWRPQTAERARLVMSIKIRKNKDSPWPVDLLQIQVSWPRTRERRGQTRDGHWHLTIERYSPNIILVNEMDRPLSTESLAGCEVVNTLTV